MDMVELNAFQTYWSLGYKRLVPIIPPDVELSPTSSLAKRKDARGKAVGVRRRDGLWSGFDWGSYEADSHDIDRWNAMGAGIGIKTGEGLLAIDADTLSAEHAKTIRDIVEKHLGRLPVRVGRYPKALYLCRVNEPYRYTRVEFGERNEKGSLQERVEVLSNGRQFVAHGVHPITRKPYDWPRDIVAFDALPVFDAATIDAVMAELQKTLPAAAPMMREGAQADVRQETLRGPLEAVREAVAAIPNTSDFFATRESYLAVGYAIKAALPDDETAAFDLFQEWCARWRDGDNDLDIVEADWRRMKPPFKRGAMYLYELADSISHDPAPMALHWFDDMDTVCVNPFEEVSRKQEQAVAQDVFPLLTIDEIVNRPEPKWLIERHIPEKSVGFIYSEPGAGKSFLALDMALSITHRLPTWQGDRINAQENPAVVYIAAEGSFDLGNRIQAWLNRRGLADRLSKSFLLLEQTVNFMSPDDIAKLLRTLKTVAPRQPVLVVVDTVSRALPGADENLQKDMTLFVRACDAVRDAFSCAVLGIHHAGKSGDMRGSTVLLGAGDFVFRLARRKGTPVGEFYCEKQKAAPDGWTDYYRLDTVQLQGDRSSLVVEREETGIGPRADLTPDLAASVLRAMDTAWFDGEPWSKAPQAGERRAVRRMVSDFGFTADKAENLLSLWEQLGTICVEAVNEHKHIKGYRVIDCPETAIEIIPELETAILTAMDTAWNTGSPWSKAPQAGERRAVQHLVSDFGLTAGEAKKLLSVWEQAGVLRVEMANSKTRLKGYRVVNAPVLTGDVFE